MKTLPRLYSDLASWFPLLTAPQEYAEEARSYRKLLRAFCRPPPVTLLELGSGGGNNAFHLKEHFKMTLVDLSSDMLAVSRRINPGCEHLQGDMRSVRLRRTFDAVFVHDAVSYMTTKADLRRAMKTVFVHLRAGGAALVTPDFFRETFRSGVECGGHDFGGRAMRYLEWTWEPNSHCTTYVSHFTFILKERDGTVRYENDRHAFGLFSRRDWFRILRDVGFQQKAVMFESSKGRHEALIAMKPPDRF